MADQHMGVWSGHQPGLVRFESCETGAAVLFFCLVWQQNTPHPVPLVSTQPSSDLPEAEPPPCCLPDPAGDPPPPPPHTHWDYASMGLANVAWLWLCRCCLALALPVTARVALMHCAYLFRLPKDRLPTNSHFDLGHYRLRYG
jgi:hypothetical protein